MTTVLRVRRRRWRRRSRLRPGRLPTPEAGPLPRPQHRWALARQENRRAEAPRRRQQPRRGRPRAPGSPRRPGFRQRHQAGAPPRPCPPPREAPRAPQRPPASRPRKTLAGCAPDPERPRRRRRRRLRPPQRTRPRGPPITSPHQSPGPHHRWDPRARTGNSPLRPDAQRSRPAPVAGSHRPGSATTVPPEDRGEADCGGTCRLGTHARRSRPTFWRSRWRLGRPTRDRPRPR